MAYWLWSVPPDNFPVYDRAGTFAVRRVGRQAMQAVRPGDRIVAYLPGRRVIAGLYEVTSPPFEDATALVPGGHYPHRVRVRPLVRLSEEAWVAYDAFAGKLTVLDEYPDLDDPDRQFRAVAQRVVHPLPSIDGKVLEFLVRAREGRSFDELMAAFERLRQAQRGEEPASVVGEPASGYQPELAEWDRAAALERLIDAVAARGFVYQPWQIAAYVTALRTKPLVILAGVTGVGKSRLPVLVAEATGGTAHVIPVRPDWTDSADVLGYTDLQGDFRPGALLTVAREAAERGGFTVAVLDEMNLARPEHYLAEVLSRIESRRLAPGGGFESAPLLADRAVTLPPNLGLVGTVNMDESAYGFSRKVLDRAFTLELSDVDLGTWRKVSPQEEMSPPEPWPVAAWRPRALTLGGLADLSERVAAKVERVVAVLTEANGLLAPAGLGVGYRLRDEAALFVLHAAETPDAFRTRDGEAVDPLDLALFMKLLPRIAGGSRSVRQALFALLGWASDGTPLRLDDDVRERIEAWERSGRPPVMPAARYPRTAARLALMTDRLLADGFASFWE
ncbi:MAG: AAA family ATPase [Rhodothermales bacterium]